jgi:hypothetical protein
MQRTGEGKMLKIYDYKWLAIFLMVFGINVFGADLTYAEDLYYAQISAGGANGGNCANAKAISTLTWGTGIGNIGAGDTAHICGTITSTLAVGAGGSLGSPVTVKFEDGAKFSAATWMNGSAIITVNGYSYVVIDGGTNGIIEATNNGTNRTYKNEFAGISFNNAPNIEIKNMKIQNLFVHEATGATGAGAGALAITSVDSSGNSNNASIHNNTLRHCMTGIAWNTAVGVHDISVYNNTIEYINRGIRFGSRGSNSSISNVYVYNNNIGYGANWDDPATNNFHKGYLHFWNYNTNISAVTNLKIYNNYFYGSAGKYKTAAIFLEGYATNPLVYNNKINTDMQPIYSKFVNTHHRIFNNTLYVGAAYTYGYLQNGVGATGEFYNNIITGLTATPYSAGSLTMSNNILSGTDPKLNVDLTLQSNSPAIGAGANLSVYFTTDFLGNTRIAPWDIGAYKYVGVGSPPPPPLTPSPPADILIQ